MAERIRKVSAGDLASGASTAGMVRSQAFATDHVWFGEVRTGPGVVSGRHHHGEYAIYGRVVSGRIPFEFGPGGGESVEAGPGDFFTVPPHVVHREGNPGSEEQVLIAVRIGAGPTVTHVDEPDPRSVGRGQEPRLASGTTARPG